MKKIAGGRVWTGKQAKALGLVDEIGGLTEALAEAKKLAGFPKEIKFQFTYGNHLSQI